MIDYGRIRMYVLVVCEEEDYLVVVVSRGP